MKEEEDWQLGRGLEALLEEASPLLELLVKVESQLQQAVESDRKAEQEVTPTEGAVSSQLAEVDVMTAEEDSNGTGRQEVQYLAQPEVAYWKEVPVVV